MNPFDPTKNEWSIEHLASIGLVIFSAVSILGAFSILLAGLGDQQFTTGNIEDLKRVWTGNASSYVKTAGNWQSLEAPLFGSDLEFTEAAKRKSVFNDFTDGQVFRSIKILGSGYKFEGAKYSITGGITSTHNVAFTAPLSLKANQKFSLGAATATTVEFAALNLETANLELFADKSQEITVKSTVLGVGDLRKTGEGKLTLSGQYNEQGILDVIAGRVQFNGIGERLLAKATETGQLSLMGGAALQGISMKDSSQLIVASSVVNNPISQVENLELAPTTRFNYGLMKGLQVPSLRATGEVDLGESSLVLTNTLDPGLALGIELKLLDKTSPGPITSTFKDLSEGAILISGLNTFSLSYKGGDGNDITLTVIANQTQPVFRFYKAAKGKHFYSISAAEKDHLVVEDKSWNYEGVAFHAYSKADCQGKQQIYRFYSPSRQVHFYTINETEKGNLIARDKSWKYEGQAFCAEADKASNNKPLFRFWSQSTQSHFFTANPDEKDVLTQNGQWKYEGVAFYVR